VNFCSGQLVEEWQRDDALGSGIGIGQTGFVIAG